jgi:hypothetical protein
METRVKGSFFVKNKDCFFKVITVRGTGNKYVFEYMDVDSKQKQVFTYQVLRLLEALDAAARVTKDPKDILLADLDNQGKTYGDMGFI